MTHRIGLGDDVAQLVAPDEHHHVTSDPALIVEHVRTDLGPLGEVRLEAFGHRGARHGGGRALDVPPEIRGERHSRHVVHGTQGVRDRSVGCRAAESQAIRRR